VSDPRREPRPDADINEPKEWNDGQAVKLKWDEHGHGRPGLNEAAENELEQTAESGDEPRSHA
jgi:hypothetical protein